MVQKVLRVPFSKIKPKDMIKTWTIFPGDKVQVVGGMKDVGKTGNVIEVIKKHNMVTVEDVNMLVDPTTQRATSARLEYWRDKKTGRRVLKRRLKSSGELLDIPKKKGPLSEGYEESLGKLDTPKDLVQQETWKPSLFEAPFPARFMNQLERFRRINKEGLALHYIELVGYKATDVDLKADILSVKEALLSSKKSAAAGKSLLISQRAVLETDLELLTLLEKVHRELQSFDVLIGGGELAGAATSITDARALLDEISEQQLQDNCPSELYKALKSEVLSRKSMLKHRFEELFRTAFLFSTKNGISELMITFRIVATASAKYDSPLYLSSLLTVIHSSGLFSTFFTRFVDEIVQKFIMPIIQSPNNQLTTTKTKLHATLKFGDGAALIRNTQQPAGLDVIRILDNILTLCKFLRDNLFPKNESTPELEAFSNIFGDQIFSIILRSVLDPSIPEDKIGLEKYQEIADKVISFDREMKAAGLVYPDAMELLEFVSKINLLYARRRRSALLVTVRQIIEDEDQNTSEVTDATERGSLNTLLSIRSGNMAAKNTVPTNTNGKGGATGKQGQEINDCSFRLPTCYISVQAQTLVELAYNTLHEAASLDPESAVELYYCARDIFDLFRAIAPVVNADSIQNMPTRTIIFYNDCQYFAHHLLTLGYQCQPRMPKSISNVTTFLDLIPSFRKLGEMHFRSQMRRQRDIILGYIKEAQGFGNLTDDERLDVVERSVKQALYHIMALSRSWKPILASDMYLRAIGLLVDSFVESVMNEVNTLKEINKDEAHQLRYILNLINKLESCFEKRVGDGKKYAKVGAKIA
ncbi:Centromere/kinetochore protein zw10 [Chytridiales sp. JEL 0842]|nr:Centromere/kinetochore protein zw10 [Chytridiales sp. JEL 0842]